MTKTFVKFVILSQMNKKVENTNRLLIDGQEILKMVNGLNKSILKVFIVPNVPNIQALCFVLCDCISLDHLKTSTSK